MNSENNFYLVNKPIGISSFDVIRQMRKKLNIKKMGHTGTLDPLATGLMLIATGNYTKLIPYFEKDTKSYVANIALDGISASFDSETEILYLSEEKKQYFNENLKIEDIEKVLKQRFTGEILQTPPKYSALKIGGKKAYELAREGKDFEMKKRKATILDIKIVKYTYPLLVLEIKVSAGTYIRSIANELGEFLKTGGYLTGLERTEIGCLNIKDSISLDNLELENSLDVKKIFTSDKFINIDDFSESDIKRIDNGLTISYRNKQKNNGKLFIFKGNDITNIVLFDDEKIIPKRKI